MDFEVLSISKLNSCCKNEIDSERNPEPHFLVVHFSTYNIENFGTYGGGSKAPAAKLLI